MLWFLADCKQKPLNEGTFARSQLAARSLLWLLSTGQSQWKDWQAEESEWWVKKAHLQAATAFSVNWSEFEAKGPVGLGTACYFGHVGKNRYQRVLWNIRKRFKLWPKGWAGRTRNVDSRDQLKVGKHTNIAKYCEANRTHGVGTGGKS